MEYTDIFNRVSRIMRKVFEDPGMAVSDDISSGDVARWNSLNHVVLIAEIEKEFGIKFGLSDVLELKTAGDICRKIESISSPT